MDIISWQEITVRILFAFILGSAAAISRKWYQTRQLIQSVTQMALGTVMLAILASSISPTALPQLILGISIICIGIGWSDRSQTNNISINTVTRLWCAGAVASVVGFGFFVPAYIGTIAIILTNLVFQSPEKNFVPNLEPELLKPELKRDLRSPTEPTPEIYQCRINCLATNEAEVLALLVQLAQQHSLTLTGISSRDVPGNQNLATIETVIDFVGDSHNSAPQLQAIIVDLKSKLEVNSAKWIVLSSGVSDLSYEADNKTVRSS